MTAYFGRERKTVLYLEVDTGYGYDAALGVEPDTVTIWFSKAGSLFEIKELDDTNWAEMGGGYYSVTWSESDMDTLGQFLYFLNYPYQGNFKVQGTFDVDPEPLSISADAPTCVVTGNMLDISGEPLDQAKIVFRPKNIRTVIGPSLVGSRLIKTTPDAFGNFSVKLIRGAQAIVEIEELGIRILITVPDLPTATLISLLPPLSPA